MFRAHPDILLTLCSRHCLEDALSATAWTGDNRDAHTCRCAFSSTHVPATARPETHLSPSRSAYSLRLHKNHTSLNCLGCTPTRHTSVTHVPPTSILVCLLLSSARAPHMGRWTRGTVYPPRSPIPRAAYASPPSSRLCLATPLPCVRSGPFVPFPKSTVRTARSAACAVDVHQALQGEGSTARGALPPRSLSHPFM